MTELLESAWVGISNAFNAVGLSSPISRGLAMGAVGAAVEWNVRPSYSYRPDGSPRPWIVLSGDSVDSTYLPMGSTAIITGMIFGLFV